jgi:Family of unknown function (DUF5856)
MSCPNFIAQSFAVRTAAHLLHLSSSSYSQHVALGDFYEALAGLVDRYAEAYMGMNALVKSWPSKTPPNETPTGLLEDYLEFVQAEQGEDESEALENILAEIEELTMRTLYKVRNLK